MARRTHGRTFKIGKVYYCEFFVKGTRFKKRLLDAAGHAVTHARDVEAARERLVKPYMAADEVERRQDALAALRTAQETRAEAERLASGDVLLSKVWEKHTYDTNERAGEGSAERRLCAGTVADNLRMWTRFVEWARGQGLTKASDITHEAAETYRRHLQGQGISGRRVNMLVMLARVMFRKLKVRPNPFDDLREVAHTTGKRLDLPEPVIAQLLAAATGDMKLLAHFGVFAGMRLGDACRVRWENVSPDLSRITFTPSKTAYKDGAEIEMPLHPDIQDILALTPPAQRRGYIMPAMASQYEASNTVPAMAFAKLLRQVGVEPHEPGTGEGTGRRAVVRYGFHSLRHSFVSIAARRGVPLSTVQALCGHSADVQRRYLHANNEDRQKAIAALPRLNGHTEDDAERKDRARLVQIVGRLPIAQVRDILKSLQA